VRWTPETGQAGMLASLQNRSDTRRKITEKQAVARAIGILVSASEQISEGPIRPLRSLLQRGKQEETPRILNLVSWPCRVRFILQGCLVMSQFGP
jgi:hypothetical protein